MPATYTVKQVADLLGYSTNSIYTFLKENRIRSVRVGKGRFRIPQSELNRLLLHSNKAVEGVSAVVGPVVSPARTAELVSVAPLPRSTDMGQVAYAGNAGSATVPSLFDWFVSIASIVLGSSMFLFSRHLDEFAVMGFAQWMSPVRIAIIASGIGLMLTDVIGKSKTWWRIVFLSILIFGYGALAAILWFSGDFVGVLLFGSLAGVITASLLSGISGIASFSLYIACMTFTLPVVFRVIALANPTLIWWATMDIRPVTGIIGVAIIGIGINALLFLAYRRFTKVFWTIMAMFCGMLIGLSIWYTGQMYWGRAFFLLVTAMTGLFLPSWHSLSFEHKSDRKIVFLSFGTVLALFLLAIGVVRLLQTAMLQFAGTQLTNKAAYGRLVVESTVLSVEQTLEGVSQDSVLISAIQKKDTQLIHTVNRGIFEANRRFKYLATFDATASAMSVFPFDAEVMGKNYADVPYFQKAIESKTTVITNIFQENGTNFIPMVAFVVPVLDTNNDQVLGLLFGVMDLASLGDRLQGIASPELGEYFVLIDANGKRLIHDQPELLNTLVNTDSPLRDGLRGKAGMAEVYSSGNERMLMAYDALPDQKWAIGIQAPMTRILAMTHAGTIVITALIFLTLTVLGVLWSARRTYRHTRVNGGGSP